MSTEGNGAPVLYKVRMSQQVKDDLREQLVQSIALGKGQQFLDALRKIRVKLRQEPATFGEPLYQLATPNLVVYQGVIAPVVVDYAVHNEETLVFIRGFRLLS